MVFILALILLEVKIIFITGNDPINKVQIVLFPFTLEYALTTGNSSVIFLINLEPRIILLAFEIHALYQVLFDAFLDH